MNRDATDHANLPKKIHESEYIPAAIGSDFNTNVFPHVPDPTFNNLMDGPLCVKEGSMNGKEIHLVNQDIADKAENQDNKDIPDSLPNQELVISINSDN